MNFINTLSLFESEIDSVSTECLAKSSSKTESEISFSALNHIDSQRRRAHARTGR